MTCNVPVITDFRLKITVVICNRDMNRTLLATRHSKRVAGYYSEPRRPCDPRFSFRAVTNFMSRSSDSLSTAKIAPRRLHAISAVQNRYIHYSEACHVSPTDPFPSPAKLIGGESSQSKVHLQCTCRQMPGPETAHSSPCPSSLALVISTSPYERVL